MGFFIEYHDIYEEIFEIIVHDEYCEEVETEPIVVATNTISGYDNKLYDLLQFVMEETMEEQRRNLVFRQGKVSVVSFPFNMRQCFFAVDVPAWQGGTKDEVRLLRECYESALQTALKKKCNNITFPLLGDGEHGYPIDLALDTALSVLGEYAQKMDIDIFLVPCGQDDDLLLREKARHLEGLTAFIDEFFIKPQPIKRNDDRIIACECKIVREGELEAIIPNKQKGELFWEYVQALIQRTGKGKVEIYKRANLDRRLISKIKTNSDFLPGKRTILALAIAMHLSLDETRALLEQAGYALSPSVRMDVIIRYFIEKQEYDIYSINHVLYSYGEALLGSVR